MNVTQLRALVAVADTGSITHAAERIGLTQSGASQALSALEDHLAVRLVRRGRRGVTLTHVGEGVAARARDALAALDAIRRTADGARGLETGRIRLASVPSVFATLLPPLLQRFHARHPGIEVVALEATDREVAALLEAGTADIGVVAGPATPGRTVVPLHRDEWVAVLPAGHALARGGAAGIPLDSLAREPFVVATGGCSTHARTVARQAGLELADIRVEVHDWTSALALVREGLGVSLVPALNLPDDRRGLRVLPLAEPVHRDLSLEVSPDSAGSAIVLAFLDTAATIGAGIPPRPDMHSAETWTP